MEPLKRQQRKVDNEYTIMFIPHRGKEPKSFSFRASLLKKIGIFCGILLLAGIGIAAKSSMVVYQAHQEQNELIAYRNDKAAQDQRRTRSWPNCRKKTKKCRRTWLSFPHWKTKCAKPLAAM